MDWMLIYIAVVLFIAYLGWGVTQAQVRKQQWGLLAYPDSSGVRRIGNARNEKRESSIEVGI